jgi:small subunit ribosomal protein S20
VARIKSAVKNIRKSRKRRDINRARRSALRTQIKKMRVLLDKKQGAEARQALPTALSTIDRAVSKGVLHRNAAARRKSRLMRHVASLEKAS